MVSRLTCYNKFLIVFWECNFKQRHLIVYRNPLRQYLEGFLGQRQCDKEALVFLWVWLPSLRCGMWSQLYYSYFQTTNLCVKLILFWVCAVFFFFFKIRIFLPASMIYVAASVLIHIFYCLDPRLISRCAYLQSSFQCSPLAATVKWILSLLPVKSLSGSQLPWDNAQGSLRNDLCLSASLTSSSTRKSPLSLRCWKVPLVLGL